jgi:flagellar biosynthetic protein FliS
MAYANPFYAYNHANETKSRTEQIVMLYCAAISYMQQAKVAAEQNDHDTRYKLIDKTMSIMRGLRACLDFSANEDVALALNNYYAALENLLISAQLEENKAEICEQIIKNLQIIKQSWEKMNTTDITPSNDENLPPPEEADSYKPQDITV